MLQRRLRAWFERGRSQPTFTIGEGVKLIPVGELVHVTEPPSGFTVLGAGKTALGRWFEHMEPALANAQRLRTRAVS